MIGNIAGMRISGAVSGPPASSRSTLDVGVLAQPPGEHAPGRTGSDDHVVSHSPPILPRGAGRVDRIRSPRRGEQRPCRALLDDVGPGGDPRGPRMEPLRPRRPLRSTPSASDSRASGSGTPTCSTSSRRGRSPTSRPLLDDHGLEHLELEFCWEWFLDPGRRAPRARPSRSGSCCSRRRPRSMRITSRWATSPARRASSPLVTERFGELCARRRAAARRHGWSTSSCRRT